MTQQETSEGKSLVSIGIVGGGRGGLEMVKLFSASESCHIRYITDITADAPAMKEGRHLSIPVFTRPEETVRSCPVNFIIDTTGVPGVRDMLHRAAPEGAEILGGSIAMFLFSMVNENRIRTNNVVRSEIMDIQECIGKETLRIAGLLADISDTSLVLKILALNTGVEAARAGVYGRGFAVFAEEIKKISDSTKSLIGRIEEVNSSIAELSTRITLSLTRLE